jgi:cobalt-precorrin 5A hydrolase
MKIALLTLSQQGAELLKHLLRSFAGAHLFVHEAVPGDSIGQRFGSIVDLAREIFERYDGLVFAAPSGVVMRAISPLVKDKHKDPAVLVIDVGGRFVISLLGGHEGGANHLAIRVSNILGAEPVITTTAEALKDLIVGIGCRRGTDASKIVSAVKEALRLAGGELSQVRLLASADLKAEEKGLFLAAEELEVPLRLIHSEEIRGCGRDFSRSEFVEKKVKMPAVAEPAALLAGRRTKLILPKIIRNGVTVAVAQESFLWSESVRGSH